MKYDTHLLKIFISGVIFHGRPGNGIVLFKSCKIKISKPDEVLKVTLLLLFGLFFLSEQILLTKLFGGCRARTITKTITFFSNREN